MPGFNAIEEIPELIFPVNLILIEQYQCNDLRFVVKYKVGTHQKCYFRGGSNIVFDLIMCEDNNVITLILHSYLLHCYRTYLLYTGTYRTEVMI